MIESRHNHTEAPPLAWLAWTETPRNRKIIRSLFLVLGLVLVAVTIRRAGWGSSEFDGFQEISLKCVLGSADPYADLGHIRAYPPLFGILFLPFAAFGATPIGMAVGGGLFGLLCLVLYTASVQLWARVTTRSESPPFRFVVLLWVAISPLFIGTMFRCETDVFVLFPLVLGGYWLLGPRRRQVAAGAALAFAASLKVIPIVYGGFLLCCRKWWRAAAGMVAGGLFLCVLVPVAVWGPPRTTALYRSWIEHVVAPYHSGGATSFISSSYRSANQSMTAVVFRYLTPANAGKGMFDHHWFKVNFVAISNIAAARIAALLRIAAGLGMLALWIGFGNRDSASSSRDIALFAGVPLGMLLLSEVSLTTHHLLLLLPFGLLTGRRFAPDATPFERRSAPQWALLAWIVLLLGAFPFLKALGSTFYATLALCYGTVKAVLLADRRADTAADVPRSPA